ncbi:MAG TPA: Amuc_1099 family pilus-like system protein [Candidatus Methylacidiphilales bacterium]|nr:Amuc_1099 family pilus-like system protein [Candidatus Methylacidiphilales bacterium]
MKTTSETIILASALVLLAAGGGALGYFFPTIQDLTGVNTVAPVNSHKLRMLTEDDVKASFDPWTSPASWPNPVETDEDHRYLFISDPYLFFPALYPNGNYIQKLTKDARSPKGVLIGWYQKYHIDFTASDVDRQDPDGDGFSNLTEFKNEQPGQRLDAFKCDGSSSTNPLDPATHPSYLSRLRLEKYDRRPFHIQFLGYEQLDGVYQFQIYLADVPSYLQPRYKHTGDPLGFDDLIVGKFTLNIVKKEDPNTHTVTPEDDSTLVLYNPKTGSQVTLTYRQSIDSPESTADFVMLMPTEVGKEIKVPVGKTFSVPFVPSKQYLLIKIQDDGSAVIKDNDPSNPAPINVLKLESSDWDEVPVSNTTNSPDSTTSSNSSNPSNPSNPPAPAPPATNPS